MMRNLLTASLSLLLIACASVPPPITAPVLALVHDTGGTWPRVTAANIYANGTLELSDASGVVRVRVGEGNQRFRELMEMLRTATFEADLAAASIPTIEWKSTGEWIRVERGQVISRVKPPNVPPALCAAIGTVDALFERWFGRRYEAMLAPDECSSAVPDPPAARGTSLSS